jgi:hypothetical protein
MDNYKIIFKNGKDINISKRIFDEITAALRQPEVDPIWINIHDSGDGIMAIRADAIAYIK